MNLESLKTAINFACECTAEDDAIIIAVKRRDTVRMCVEGAPLECNKLKQKLYSLVGGREAK